MSTIRFSSAPVTARDASPPSFSESDLRGRLAIAETRARECDEAVAKAQRLTGERNAAVERAAKVERQNREHVETIAILRGELERLRGAQREAA